MPRVHPNEVIAPEVVEMNFFTSGDNPKAREGQARVTKLLTAPEGRALGSGGETEAYSKERMVIADKDVDTKEAVSFAFTTGSLFNAPMSVMNNPQKGGDRGMLTRAVASYETDKLLGLNSLAEEKFGFDANKKVIGLSIRADGEGITSANGWLAVDYSDPNIQRGLSDLEVSDYITGQTDRHAGNVFVDPVTGKVTGIDSDMAFPEVDREGIIHGDRLGKMVGGMPRRMHVETAQKILKSDPDELRALLSKPPPGKKNGPQPLSPAAIEGAVERLRKLKAELEKEHPSIELVTAFNKQTYATAIGEQAAKFQTENNMSLADFDPSTERLGAAKVINCPRTSYLGSMAMVGHAESLNPDPVTRIKAHTEAPKAPRASSGMQEREVYQQMSPKQKKEFDKEFKYLRDAETKLAEKSRQMFDGPNAKKLASLQQEVGDLKNEIGLRNAALDKQINSARFSLGLQPPRPTKVTPVHVTPTPLAIPTQPSRPTTVTPHINTRTAMHQPPQQQPTPTQIAPQQNATPKAWTKAVLKGGDDSTSSQSEGNTGKVLKRRSSVRDMTGIHSDTSSEESLSNSQKQKLPLNTSRTHL